MTFHDINLPVVIAGSWRGHRYYIMNKAIANQSRHYLDSYLLLILIDLMPKEELSFLLSTCLYIII